MTKANCGREREAQETRGGRGGGALRMGIRVRRLEVEDDIIW